MTKTILVSYATRYGTTQAAAGVVAEALRGHGFEVELLPAREVRALERYHAVVLGAPLFMFHWHNDALQFLSRHQKALAERPTALFALGPVQSPINEQEWKDSREQLHKELARFIWLKPLAVEVFGGKYDPSKLGFPLKLFAGAAPASDIQDLAAVRAWAAGLAVKFEPAAA